MEARSNIRDKASQDYMIIIYHIWRYPNTLTTPAVTTGVAQTMRVENKLKVVS